ncbi:hypothetical protein H7X69_02350 [Candidatus Saccharibacteria bacterium]|nr:hypothetical protein [Candidatus Saccharibacteria bacterium]
MEPETSTPQLGPEQAPIQYRPNIERGPVLPTPERGIETGAERREQAAEPSIVPTGGGLTTILPTPVLTDVPTADDSSVVSDTPIVAGDDDLIEKEWVEKAKKIVAETRDNPYGREKAVSQLQRDYLMKRYGRELGEA